MKNRFRIILSVPALLLVSCASGEKAESCPSEAEEPISVCRAREKCQNQNSSIGVGVGVGLGHFGFGVGRSQATNRYERCLDRELAAQKEKMKKTEEMKTPASAP